MYGERRKSYVGEFEVGQKMFVSDPCYSRVDETDRCSAVVPVIPGTWKSEIVLSDEGTWGNRVAELHAWHINPEAQNDYAYRNLWNWEFYSQCGVDSGQLGFFDYEKYPIGVDDYEANYDDPDNWYKKACYETCNLSLDQLKAGIVEGMGVNSSSGFGDGSYEVFVARNTDDKVVAIKVVFIPEDEDNND